KMSLSPSSVTMLSLFSVTHSRIRNSTRNEVTSTTTRGNLRKSRHISRSDPNALITSCSSKSPASPGSPFGPAGPTLPCGPRMLPTTCQLIHPTPEHHPCQYQCASHRDVLLMVHPNPP